MDKKSSNVKTRLIDDILLKMSSYLDSSTLDILQSVLEEQFLNINMEKSTTLPNVIHSNTETKNNYYMNLMKLKRKNLSDRTLYNYLLTIRRLSNYINKSFDEMDELDIDAYLTYYEHKYDSISHKYPNAMTWNNERRYLSTFFNWMKKEKFIDYNPVENIEPKKVIKKPIDYFYPQQMEQLREGCKNLRDLALIEFLRSTGARVGEVININKSDINWETGDVLILSEKSDKYRMLYLDEVSRYHLKKYLDSRVDDNDALFVYVNKPYERLTIVGIEFALKRIAKRGGVKGRVYPHKMRKTLGMNLKKSGVDIGYIQEILGHANPDTTARYYAESTPETLRDIRKKAGT